MTAADAEYISQYGWAMYTPAEFVHREIVGRSDSLSSPKVVDFAPKNNTNVSLTWSVIPGKEIDFLADRRFHRLASILLKDPKRRVDAAVILAGIQPQAGPISDVSALEFKDGSCAIEFVETIDKTKTYIVLWPLEPPVGFLFRDDSERATSCRGASVYNDPALHEMYALDAPSLGLIRGISGGDPVENGGYEHYQRIVFQAPVDQFERLLPAVKRAVRTFHYLKKPPAMCHGQKVETDPNILKKWIEEDKKDREGGKYFTIPGFKPEKPKN